MTFHANKFPGIGLRSAKASAQAFLNGLVKHLNSYYICRNRMTSAFCAVEGSAEAAGNEFKKTVWGARSNRVRSGDDCLPLSVFFTLFSRGDLWTQLIVILFNSASLHPSGRNNRTPAVSEFFTLQFLNVQHVYFNSDFICSDRCEIVAAC